MNGISRSMIVAAVTLLAGVLTIFGVTLSEEMQATIVANLDAVIGGLLALYGIIVGVLRKITSTPLTGVVTKELPK